MSTQFDYFGGVDFSGGREPLGNLWSAVGVERDGRLCIVDLRPHAFREDLLHFLCRDLDALVDSAGAGEGSRRRALWGMDFPFSLPGDVATALMGRSGPVEWREQVDWLAYQSAADLEASARPHRQVMRAIDPPGAMAPLNIRLLKQTLAGARLLDELVRQQGAAVVPQMEAGDAPCVFIEVYPSATGADVGLKPRRPARAGHVRARPKMLAPCMTFAHPSLEAAAVTLEDAWDATLACLTAWLVRDDLNQPRRLGRHDAGTLAREGWIYRHPDAI